MFGKEIMKSYPTIPTVYDETVRYHIFDKLDGSNIRVEWDRKSGFTRFGTRRELMAGDSPFAPAKTIILDKYASDLESLFRRQKYEKAVCFFEYFGPGSFAGDHCDPASDMDAVLIDVNPHRKGMLSPDQFLDLFGHLELPRYLGCRYLDPELVDQVRTGIFEGMTFEGVVAKAVIRNRLRMTKVKNLAWLERLKLSCDSEEEFTRRA